MAADLIETVRTSGRPLQETAADLDPVLDASLPAQFDAVLHFDRTSAVRPLETTAEWTSEEAPETFPTGM